MKNLSWGLVYIFIILSILWNVKFLYGALAALVLALFAAPIERWLFKTLEIKICPHCSSRISKSATRCKYCGEPVILYSDIKGDFIHCPQCDQVNPEKSKMCEYCGATLKRSYFSKLIKS